MRHVIVVLFAAFALTACTGGSLLGAFNATPTVEHDPNKVLCGKMKLTHWYPIDTRMTIYAIKLANDELRRSCPGIKDYWPAPPPEDLPPPRLTQPGT